MIYLAYFAPMKLAKKIFFDSGLVAVVDLGTIALVATAFGVLGPLLLHRLVKVGPLRWLFVRPSWARLTTAAPAPSAPARRIIPLDAYGLEAPPQSPPPAVPAANGSPTPRPGQHLPGSISMLNPGSGPLTSPTSAFGARVERVASSVPPHDPYVARGSSTASTSELITSWEALDPLEHDWDRLWQAGAGSRGRCYSYRWVRELVRLHDRGRAPTTPWCVVVRAPTGQVTGIAPFVLERGRPRRVTSLPELVEWNHCLLHEGPVDALARAIVHHLDRGWMDGLRFRGVLRTSALELVQAWGGSWRCSVQRISEMEGSGVAGTTWWDRRAIPINGTWEEFLRSRGGNYRSSLKRSLKRLGQAGTVRFWRHSAGQQLFGEPLSNDEILAAIRPIEERAWQGERHFGPGGDGELKLDILRRQGLLELSLLYLDGKPISYIFGSAAGRVGTLKYLGFEPAHTELSPGVITLAELVRTTCEARHLDELNLHGSEHRYKAQLADVVESAFVVELTGRTPRGLASAMARRVRPGFRATGTAAIELLASSEPLGQPGEGVQERARVARLNRAHGPGEECEATP